MAKRPKFHPFRSAKGLVLNIPPNLTEDGTRQRRYFKKKAEAEGLADQLSVRWLNETTRGGARLLSASQEEQAAAAFQLLSKAETSITLPEIVGQHLVRIEKSKASKPFVEAFDIFTTSKKSDAPPTQTH